MKNSGLGEYFEQMLSADTVQRLKPAPEPYRMAAERLGVEIGEIRLVAAPRLGRGGCAKRRLRRQLSWGVRAKVPDPLVETPDVVGEDLLEVADGIIAAEGRG